MYKKIG